MPINSRKSRKYRSKTSNLISLSSKRHARLRLEGLQEQKVENYRNKAIINSRTPLGSNEKRPEMEKSKGIEA